MMSVWTLKYVQAPKLRGLLASGRVNANPDAVSPTYVLLHPLAKVKFQEDPALPTLTASRSTVVELITPALQVIIVKAVLVHFANQTQLAVVWKTPAFWIQSVRRIQLEVPVWVAHSANLIAVARRAPAKKLALIRTSTILVRQIATATVNVARSTKDRVFVEIRLLAQAVQSAHSVSRIRTAPQVVDVAKIMCVNLRRFAQTKNKLEKNVAVDQTAFQDAAMKGFAIIRRRAIKNSNFGKSWFTLCSFPSLSC